jgi:diaminopimelate epimerase
MKISFEKYHGCGNDFIIINNLSKTLPNLTKDIIKQLCNRKFGIGADGLIIVNESSEYPFKMTYYNSDGNISTMCGNGGRCVVHHCYSQKIVGENSDFIACDGVHSSVVNGNFVKISMNNVSEYKVVDENIFIDTGSPHLVIKKNKLNDIDIIPVSREIQKTKLFKNEGVNVNFLSIINENIVNLRTYERGVENETLSCGTGAVAAALSTSIFLKSKSQKVIVKTKGGDLIVDFKHDNNNFYDIYLSGEVEKVFSGIYNYEEN